jgi:Ca-activated chloride channel family protein
MLAAMCTLATALPLGGAHSQPAQDPPVPQHASSQDEPQARIRARAELVVVPVTVKDAQGRLVFDIRQEEFRILEDDVEQSIDVYSNEAFPLSAVLLIDNDLPPKTAEQVESSLPAIAGGFSPNDEVFVCRFDQQFHPGKGFLTDTDQLLSVLQRADVKSSLPPAPASGPFASGPRINGIPAPGAPQQTPATKVIKGQTTKTLDDAIYEAAELLKDRDRARRKIIFLVSDGLNSKQNTNSFDDTARVLLTAGISVYGVGVGNAVFSRNLSPLAKYAHATGGDVFYAANREALEKTYSVVTEEARNQYTLAYVPRNTDRSLDYHSIEVRVKRPHLTLLTRDGYYSGGAK